MDVECTGDLRHLSKEHGRIAALSQTELESECPVDRSLLLKRVVDHWLGIRLLVIVRSEEVLGEVLIVDHVILNV